MTEGNIEISRIYLYDGIFLLCESIGENIAVFRRLDEKLNRINLFRQETDMVILGNDKFKNLLNYDNLPI